MAGRASEYVELRCKSVFSFLQGSSEPEALVERAAELGHDTLALGDISGLYGSPRFHKAAVDAGLKGLVGADLRLHEGGRVLVLVQSRAGYRNLCKLITNAKLALQGKGDAPVSFYDLELFNHGLLCLTGPDLVPGQELTALGRLLRIFGRERLFVELQRHFQRDEERRLPSLLALAESFTLPVVATNDVRYAEPGARRLFDALTCLHHKTTLDKAGRALLANAERHLKPSHEMSALFADLPQAIANTRRVAERCEFTLRDLGYRFPDFPLPPGETPTSFLRGLVYAGARDRYGLALDSKVRRQLDRELALIVKLQLEGYFLIVWDIVRFCQRNEILAQGRGSAANSAVCYALGITAVDAVGYELLFERFLSEERGEWPDIDLDLPSGDQRERVIQHVYEKYGARGAAMTANVVTYRGRLAAREMGKVAGLSPDQIDKLASQASPWPGSSTAPDQEQERWLLGAGVDPASDRAKLFVELWHSVLTLPRHLSQHPGGMVIAAGRLDEVVPLEPAAMDGRVVIQWDKDDCADLGILKIDLLGLGMLDALEQALPLIREHDGAVIDLAHLPQDDPAVYEMLQQADTVGLFQVESRAQMVTLPRMKPSRFYDLVVEVALIRPGPIVGKMVNPYLERRAGRQEVSYPHPSLEPILKRTLGVPIFQEQLMRIAMAAGGFSGGQAEELRRAMGFKRSSERMGKILDQLRRGMNERGIAAEAQQEIVRGIGSFAQYGFPESHAASFALIAYASAYLKAHHPTCFLTALLNAYPLGFYAPAVLIKDAQRHGVCVLPIDVSRSGVQCRVERLSANAHANAHANANANANGRTYPNAVRLGLRYVSGLRRDRAEAIEAEQARDSFRSPADLARRCQLGKVEMNTLAEIGALGSLGLARREAVWQAAKIGKPEAGMLPGLDEAPQRARARARIDCPLPPMSPIEKTVADFRGTGMTTGAHPMVHLREELRRTGVIRAANLERSPDGQWVRVAGLVTCRQRPHTAKGFLFITLEDETGFANLIVRPKIFERNRALILSAGALIAEGSVQKHEGTVQIKVGVLEDLALHGIEARSHDFH